MLKHYQASPNFLSFAGHLGIFAGHLIEFNCGSSPGILKICRTSPACLANFGKPALPGQGQLDTCSCWFSIFFNRSCCWRNASSSSFFLARSVYNDNNTRNCYKNSTLIQKSNRLLGTYSKRQETNDRKNEDAMNMGLIYLTRVFWTIFYSRWGGFQHRTTSMHDNTTKQDLMNIHCTTI